MKAHALTHICVVEDDDQIRQGILFIIRNDGGFQCSAYKDAETALISFSDSIPDVIIMDIHLPGMDGIECTRRVRELSATTLIMMCTVFADSERIFSALKAGANGYILKSCAGETLINSIRDLLNGGSPMSNPIARQVVSFFSGQPTLAVLESEQLSERENAVLHLLAQGYGNKDISTRLFISVNTVRTHIYNIYSKLHVHSRLEMMNKFTGRG